MAHVKRGQKWQARRPGQSPSTIETVSFPSGRVLALQIQRSPFSGINYMFTKPIQCPCVSPGSAQGPAAAHRTRVLSPDLSFHLWKPPRPHGSSVPPSPCPHIAVKSPGLVELWWQQLLRSVHCLCHLTRLRCTGPFLLHYTQPHGESLLGAA